MRVVGALFGLLLWAVVVFVGTFWLTFPSETLAQRVEYEVPRLLGAQYVAEVGGVSPWWVGLAVHDVKLYQRAEAERPRRRPARAEEEADPEAEGEEADPAAEEEEAAAAPELVAMFGRARVRASLWSLLRRAPYVSGSVRLTDGEIDYAVGTAVDDQGGIGLADLVLSAESLPLSDLMLLLPLSASGSGTLNLDVDLHAGAEGMRDGSGHIEIGGSDLVLSDLELPNIGPLGLDLPVRSLALNADIQEGRATITNGAIDSELFQLAITGEMTLREPLDRSAVDLTITLSKLGESLASYGTFLSAAQTSEGTYQYTCRGVVSRLNAYSCTAGGGRSARSTTGGGRPRSTPVPSGDPEADEERTRRREELRARLQQRREEREARGAVRPTPLDDEEPVIDDEEPVIEDEEEPPPDEELPPEDWEDEPVE